MDDTWLAMRHYLRGGFLVDFAGSFPFNLLFDDSTSAQGDGVSRLNRLLRLLRLFKLARLVKLARCVPRSSVFSPPPLPPPPPLHLSTSSPPLHLSTSPPLHLSTSPPLHLLHLLP